MGNSMNALEAEGFETINGTKIFKGSVTEKSQLPILGVVYGKITYGSAQIKVGELTCVSGNFLSFVLCFIYHTRANKGRAYYSKIGFWTFRLSNIKHIKNEF